MFPVQSNHHVVGIPIFRHALLERSQTCTPSNGRESLGAGRTWTSALPVPRTSLRYLEVKVIEHGWEIPHKCHKIGIQMGESSKENRGLSRSFHVFPLPEKNSQSEHPRSQSGARSGKSQYCTQLLSPALRSCRWTQYVSCTQWTHESAHVWKTLTILGGEI